MAKFLHVNWFRSAALALPKTIWTTEGICFHRIRRSEALWRNTAAGSCQRLKHVAGQIWEQTKVATFLLLVSSSFARFIISRRLQTVINAATTAFEWKDQALVSIRKVNSILASFHEVHFHNIVGSLWTVPTANFTTWSTDANTTRPRLAKFRAIFGLTSVSGRLGATPPWRHGWQPSAGSGFMVGDDTPPWLTTNGRGSEPGNWCLV